MLLRSCRMICVLVVFDLPRGLFTSLGYSSRAFLVGVSEYNGMWCPSHVGLLHFTPWLSFSFDVKLFVANVPLPVNSYNLY